MSLLTSHEGGVLIQVKVVPGASRDRVVGRLGDALKVAVSRPPQDGQANAAVVRLLAEALRVKPRQVRISRGHSSAQKAVAVAGMTVAEAAGRLSVTSAESGET